MKEVKFSRSFWLRRRFIKSAPLIKLEEWMDEALLLEGQIRSDSTFQKIGSKVLLEIREREPTTEREALVLIEVVGIPSANFKTIDFDPQEVLSCELPEGAFGLSFEDLFKRVQAIRRGLTFPLEKFYHIVFDEGKIALHFFIQKDYIDSEHALNKKLFN